MYLRLKAKWLKDSNKLYSIGQYLIKILNNQQKSINYIWDALKECLASYTPLAKQLDQNRNPLDKMLTTTKRRYLYAW